MEYQVLLSVLLLLTLLSHTDSELISMGRPGGTRITARNM
jgi:hypothetical protein